MNKLICVFIFLVAFCSVSVLAQDTPKFLFDTVEPAPVVKDTVVKDTVLRDSTGQPKDRWARDLRGTSKPDTATRMVIRPKKDTVEVPVIPAVDTYKIETYLYDIPFKRRYFHEDKIDKELLRADRKDGVLDNRIAIKGDTAQTRILTQAILKDVNLLQIMVENMPANGRDSFTDNQERIRCLNAIAGMLRDFNADPNPDAKQYRKVVNNMRDMLIAYNEGTFASFCVKNLSYITLDNGKALFDNYKEMRAFLYTYLGQQDPLKMLKRLPEYANDTFAHTIIAAVAETNPDVIFNYASSTNPSLTKPVHRSPEPLVQAIVAIADQSKSPLKAMAFLGDIYNERKTVAQIDAITADEDLYFKSLIELKLRNEPMGKYSYTQEAMVRSVRYIRSMNELHESPDAVRFKIIEPLTPAELYYVIVYGQDEIYTSSFLGAFKRLMEKMKPMKGDQFLDTLHYDRFRTFIRMCAGYNTLSDFLSTMDDTAKNTLMAGFIQNLQKGKEDDLEDAVDVADAFGSITDTALTTFLLSRVKECYEQSYKQRSRKGVIIYSLLSRLLDGSRLSNNDTGANVVSARLGLPSINKVTFKDLLSDSGVVYQQVFFFGDEDGLHSYEHFTDLFRKDKRWKMVTEKYWTTITSTTGRKVVMYANLPLPDQEADEAIDKTSHLLDSLGIHPTIMIHRGHSYHLKSTMAHFTKNNKIVILGSCGGYQNLAGVLNRAPDAHIVSSKQTGTKGVNDEILRSMNNQLIDGQDVNWITMWKGLENLFNQKSASASDKEKFSDYVPPYKNLGAIFIKAYRRMMEKDEAKS